MCFTKERRASAGVSATLADRARLKVSAAHAPRSMRAPFVFVIKRSTCYHNDKPDVQTVKDDGGGEINSAPMAADFVTASNLYVQLHVVTRYRVTVISKSFIWLHVVTRSYTLEAYKELSRSRLLYAANV